jgi:acyl-coenzyme A synthetase/AMP-(fatty) acid ligase/thioesterase domain-containing protein/acyl carrier protein
MLDAEIRRRPIAAQSRAVPSAAKDGASGKFEGDLAPDPRREWKSAPELPLDFGGPVDHPFERMGDGFADVCTFDHLERVAGKYADKVAVSDGATSLTFAELLNAVNNLAARISAAVPEGKAVGLLLGNSLWYPVAMMAAMRAGRPGVPLNPRDPVERVAMLAGSAQLPAVVGRGEKLPANWPANRLVDWIEVDESLKAPARRGASFLQAAVSVDQPAIILYTSGSTGAPKGIVNSQRALLQRVQQYVDACHFGPEDVFLPLTGVATIAGCREMMTPLLSGGTLYLADIESAGIRAVRDRMKSWRVTVAYLVPALLRVLMKDVARDTFAALRMLRIGGERILWSDIETAYGAIPADCFVEISYSSTETTGTHWFLPRDYREQGATVPVGYMLPGIEYCVEDDRTGNASPGAEGELIIRSMYTTLGTWENGRVVPIASDPLDQRRRIFETGDIIRFDETGLGWIVGRKGRQVKINGRRVEPAELELVLRRAAGVADAVAIVTEANEIVAFVVCEGGDDEAVVHALRDVIRKALPPAVHPSRLHRIAEMPRLAGGKVDGVKLRTLDRTLSGTRVASPAQSLEYDDQARQIAALLWGKILNKAPSPSTCWDEAGGDSLKLLQFVMELETAFECELYLESFTVDMSFDEVVRACTPADADREMASQMQDQKPVLFILPGSIGYGPSLAAFGAEMGEAAHVVAARYPDLDDILDGQGSISVMADLVTRQITQARPEGDIKLVGYSLGGGVAFEVSKRLIKAGRAVTFLGILDTNIGPAAHNYSETLARTRQRIQSHRMTIDRMLLRTCAKIFARFGAEMSLARIIDRLEGPRTARMRFILKLELEEVLRMRAFAEWLGQQRKPLPVAAVLFRCERRGMPIDLGWNNLFKKLTVVPIVGGHLDMLVEPYLAQNRPLIEQALRSSGD